jgi:hypothetical protein
MEPKELIELKSRALQQVDVQTMLCRLYACFKAKTGLKESALMNQQRHPYDIGSDEGAAFKELRVL